MVMGMVLTGVNLPHKSIFGSWEIPSPLVVVDFPLEAGFASPTFRAVAWVYSVRSPVGFDLSKSSLAFLDVLSLLPIGCSCSPIRHSSPSMLTTDFLGSGINSSRIPYRVVFEPSSTRVFDFGTVSYCFSKRSQSGFNLMMHPKGRKWRIENNGHWARHR